MFETRCSSLIVLPRGSHVYPCEHHDFPGSGGITSLEFPGLFMVYKGVVYEWV